MCRSSKSGFTLIELLVVIAIIAILAALLFPVFIGVKARAQETRCLNNQKQLFMGFRAYMDNYNGCFPNIWPYQGGPQLDPNGLEAAPDGSKEWAGVWFHSSSGVGLREGGPCHPEYGTLWPYVHNAGVYMCPVDQGVDHKHIWTKWAKTYQLSYSANCRLSGVKVDAMPNRHQSRVLLVIHESAATINDGWYGWDNGANPTNDVATNVHYNGTCLSFVDGHAMYLPWNEIEKRRLTYEWDPNCTH